MRIAWPVCFVAIAVACLNLTEVCQGTGKLISKRKFSKLFFKLTILRHGKDKTTPEPTLSKIDQGQWKTMLSTMNGTTPEENIDNTTSSFDRILVTNTFHRSEINDGNFLYQGDILIAKDSLLNISFQTTREKRAVMAFERYRWTNDRIPYKLDPSLNQNARRVILGAMREWERSVPCIKWEVKSHSDVDFVNFFKGHGCFSAVGRNGGEQALSIGKGCEHHSIALHEMGHTLGLYHEQSRPDRDNYVNIVKKNILKGFDYQFNKFEKSIINSYGVPYDYESIMHFSATAFAKKRGLVTMKAKGNRNVQFGQRDRLSDYDVEQAKAMYNCKETDFRTTPSQTPSTTEEKTTEASSIKPPTTFDQKALTTPQPSADPNGGDNKSKTIKIKFRNLVFKLTILRNLKNNTSTTRIKLHRNDREQWEKMLGTMRGSTPEENMDNTTSSFDRILIINTFARNALDDDDLLYQGDILMTGDPLRKIQNNKRDRRAVISFDYFRWSNQRIPYKIHSSLNGNARRAILGAMREWEGLLPCVKWQVKSDSDFDFVHFYKGYGCFSSVGRNGGEQALSLGANCEQHGIALHEMGHALGIYHEQSRPDRDDYIDIVKENILEGFDSQFEKYDKSMINSHNVPYDYNSIMHYSETAFAKERGLITIKAKGNRDIHFGQRDRLSNYDVEQAKAMYGCEDIDFRATPTTNAPSTNKPTTEKQTDIPTTAQIFTNEEIAERTTVENTPSTIRQTTTQKVVISMKQTDAITTKEPSTLTRIIEKQTSIPIIEIGTNAVMRETASAHQVSTTGTLATTIIDTKLPTTVDQVAVTTLQPYANPRGGDKACVDFLSTCFKWIHIGYCSSTSPNYFFMKYFCCCTCELWQKSELSKGATCVDILPNCRAKAANGYCSNWDDQEYMENMCCHSCRSENCKDKDRQCPTWSDVGSCNSSSYVKKNCKKSCNLCH